MMTGNPRTAISVDELEVREAIEDIIVKALDKPKDPSARFPKNNPMEADCDGKGINTWKQIQIKATRIRPYTK